MLCVGFVDCCLPWSFSLRGSNEVKVARKDLKWNALPSGSESTHAWFWLLCGRRYLSAVSPELKETNDEESLGKAVKDVVWSRDTIGGGRVGPEITRCSLDSKEKAPVLVLLYSIVVWAHKAAGKRGGEEKHKTDLGERQKGLRGCLETLERQLSEINSRAELRDVTTEN